MKPKKHLGQNFLKDRSVLEKIIKAADLSSDDLVIEIGPGQGVLTEELIKHAGKVIAIEIDKNLADGLKNKFAGNNKLEIINDDVLKINLPEIVETHCNASLQHGDNYKVIANIPYYITSPIIQLFLETKYPPAEMILMVQKEVAERIVAKPGQMSILAVSVKYYAQAELLFYVDKKSFWPVPEVDSAVIKIIPSPVASRHPLPPASPELQRGEQAGEEETKRFFRVVRSGFSSKRKTLLNNLSSSFHLDKKTAEEKIRKAGIDPGSRAQELAVEDWKKLSSSF